MAPEHDPAEYGERAAETYDSLYPAYPLSGSTEATADFLAELAVGGSALELGIGTGRVALPLAQRGVPVTGVDSSPAMVEKLRAKPGGEDIPVIMGDFNTVDLRGPYHLVFVAFNTFFSLLTQEDQVNCFQRVFTALEPGGRFVIEAFVPDLSRFDRGQRTAATLVESNTVMIDATLHHAVEQRVDSNHIVITEQGTQMIPVRLRYAWPSELDLMARIAGFSLEARFGSWTRASFNDDSAFHISVWRKP
jgi:SAM-dependent methyltransferase